MKALLIAAVVMTQAAYPPLTSKERRALKAEVKHPAIITIACAGPWCRALAKDLGDIFQQAKWKVTRVNHGGVGIDDVKGIQINACSYRWTPLLEAIKRAAPSRRVTAVDDGECPDQQIFVVLGPPT